MPERLLPAFPFVLMCNDSVIDPSRAPSGKAVMKLVVHNVPYDIRGDRPEEYAAAPGTR